MIILPKFSIFVWSNFINKVSSCSDRMSAIQSFYLKRTYWSFVFQKVFVTYLLSIFIMNSFNYFLLNLFLQSCKQTVNCSFHVPTHFMTPIKRNRKLVYEHFIFNNHQKSELQRSGTLSIYTLAVHLVITLCWLFQQDQETFQMTSQQLLVRRMMTYSAKMWTLVRTMAMDKILHLQLFGLTTNHLNHLKSQIENKKVFKIN